MDIVLLGTGSPIPDPRRAGPATLVQAGGTNLLFDCGRGVLMRLAAAGIMPPAISAVVLTHMHSDHITDLNDVITTHWVMNPGPAELKIFGPVGTTKLVEATLAMLAPDIGYRLEHHADLNHRPQVSVTELAPGDQVTIGAFALECQATEHSPVRPTLGYRVTHGKAVAAIAGDTVPCAGLDAICAGAGAYVQTVIREDLVRMAPSRRLQDILDYHSTVGQAAETAQKAGVRTLVMTHYVPPLLAGQEEIWRGMAAEHFSGEIVLGDDLTRVHLED
ncbi:MAG TPA: ribonuclease Z [Caulobacteraceae bacterium]|jgi:ribonuclease Z